MSVTMNGVPARGCWMTAYDREELFEQGVEHGINDERMRAMAFYDIRLRTWALLGAVFGFGAGVLLAPLFA